MHPPNGAVRRARRVLPSRQAHAKHTQAHRHTGTQAPRHDTVRRAWWLDSTSNAARGARARLRARLLLVLRTTQLPEIYTSRR
jgi:hypothetical protein